MRVTGIEARRYTLPLDPPFVAAWDPRPRDHFDETIVIVTTDQGTHGFAGGSAVPDLAVAEPLLLGVDTGDTDRVFSVCRSIDFHHGRNWTVEITVLHVDMYLDGRLNLDDMVTERLDLAQINEGFARMETGQAARNLVVFDEIR